jgi:hypothetical protein
MATRARATLSHMHRTLSSLEGIVQRDGQRRFRSAMTHYRAEAQYAYQLQAASVPREGTAHADSELSNADGPPSPPEGAAPKSSGERPRRSSQSLRPLPVATPVQSSRSDAPRAKSQPDVVNPAPRSSLGAGSRTGGAERTSFKSPDCSDAAASWQARLRAVVMGASTLMCGVVLSSSEANYYQRPIPVGPAIVRSSDQDASCSVARAVCQSRPRDRSSLKISCAASRPFASMAHTGARCHQTVACWSMAGSSRGPPWSASERRP